jgi:hypothetical protein
MRFPILFSEKSSVSVRTSFLAVIAILFSVLPASFSNATSLTSAGLTFTGSFEGKTVTFDIPAGAVTSDKTLTIANAGSTDLTQVSVSIAEWGPGDHFVSGKPAAITMPKNLLPNSAMAYSSDGISWVRIPLVANMAGVTDHVTGTGYTDNGATVTIYTYHLTTFGAYIFAAPVAVPDPQQLSSISSIVPDTAALNTAAPVVISGSFTEKISNISLNNINMAVGSWTQTPTTVSLSMPAGASGIYSIQIYNGSAPILPVQTFTIAAALNTPIVEVQPRTKLNFVYTQCSKKGRITKFQVSPICKPGYTKK